MKKPLVHGNIGEVVWIDDRAPTCDVDVPSRASELEIILYSSGLCHAFALAMGRLYPSLQLGILFQETLPIHMFCHDDQFRIFDVLGMQREQHLARFDDTVVIRPLEIVYGASEADVLAFTIPNRKGLSLLRVLNDATMRDAAEVVQRLFPELPGVARQNDFQTPPYSAKTAELE